MLYLQISHSMPPAFPEKHLLGSGERPPLCPSPWQSLAGEVPGAELPALQAGLRIRLPPRGGLAGEPAEGPGADPVPGHVRLVPGHQVLPAHAGESAPGEERRESPTLTLRPGATTAVCPRGPKAHSARERETGAFVVSWLSAFACF